MKVTRAAICVNKSKKIALETETQVRGILKRAKVKVRASSPQLVITIGGDGTVLLPKKHYGVPFFSIGSKTSFICQSTFSNFRKKLPPVLSNLKVEPRLMLSCRLNGKQLPLALNEVGVRNPEPRILSVHLQAGDKDYVFRADGILFSTPTGSPAYCYSCGGVEMESSEKRYQAVAISPFRRLFSHLIIPPSEKCTLRLSGPERAQLFVDGQSVGWMDGKKTLTVRASKKPFYFAKV
jgi:NAD+ kinase